MPDAFIGADVIAGFPGESEKEFEETVQLCEELPLSDLHVFPYSKRPGTRAADMKDHIPAQIVTERAARLRSIATLKKAAFLEHFTGRELDILVQGYSEKTGQCRGLSRNYISASFPGGKTNVNKEVTVLIHCNNGDTCTGEQRSTLSAS
jgi:threonylcarbamoyladenosine tRNA methylthiotransferase MtaB